MLLPSDFTPEIRARFWAKVSIPDDLFGCWLWSAKSITSGYGHFTIKCPKGDYSHRIAWFLTFGEIPSTTPYVLHNCPSGDNKLCCNPSHLYLGTHAENMHDAKKKGQNAAGSRHGRSILLEAQVEEIRVLLNARTMTHKQISKRFNVCRQTIGLISQNKIWSP